MRGGPFERSIGDGYIHGTNPSEQARLVLLNRMTNDAFVQFLGVAPRMQVLEVGSGLGLLAAAVASAAEDVHVVGVERSPDQIAAAVRAACVRYVLGDAHRLDFADGCFDLVYARYVLEHVARPERVLGEMGRVARPGGRVAACENDVTLFRLDPPCSSFEHVWDGFRRYQETLGGDGRIGRRLYRLFRHAGFSRIELSVQPEVHWHGSPGFEAWIANIIGNIESARQGLVDGRFCDADQIERAIGELTERTQQPDASACFMWNRAMAVRQ
jgi:SAM-dependent methyltransferase